MKVQLVSLEALRAAVGERDRRAFVEEYPGAFLLAMGYLEVAEVQRRSRGIGKLGQLTTAVSFGHRRRHDLAGQHPLAGYAFFLDTTGGAEASVTVGRSTDCHIAVPDESVSEIHGQLTVSAAGVSITDIGSTNGTSVNLEQLEVGVSRPLADEDILSVGRYSFQLLDAATLYNELKLLGAMEEFEQKHDPDA
jgi:hypothetical protein